MMITERVSTEWLDKQNMTRGDQVGIPVDLNDLSKGLRWINAFDLDEPEFEILEKYFDLKQV